MRRPKEKETMNSIEKSSLILKKRSYVNEIELTFSTAVLLTINLVLLVISTTQIYIIAKPDTVITQNILHCSYFFTTNSILMLFVDILKPLKREKAELLKNNEVTKNDIDKAQILVSLDALFKEEKEKIMAMDPEKYTIEDKNKMFRHFIEDFKDSIVNTKSNNKHK